jgi:hypothetical protein
LAESRSFVGRTEGGVTRAFLKTKNKISTHHTSLALIVKRNISFNGTTRKRSIFDYNCTTAIATMTWTMTYYVLTFLTFKVSGQKKTDVLKGITLINEIAAAAHVSTWTPPGHNINARTYRSVLTSDLPYHFH